MSLTADPTATAPDLASLDALCGADAALRELVRSVARRQPNSLRLSHRAHRAATSLPANLPFSPPVLPICCEWAQGARLRDIDGNEYIDCHLSYSAAILGHNPPPVVAAVRQKLAGGVGAGYFSAEQVELTELVAELVPGADRVGLFHTGGEAIAASVRLARAATGRQLIAKFEGSYHGSHEVGLYNSAGLPEAVGTGPVTGFAPRPSGSGLRLLSDAELLVLPFDHEAALTLITRHAADLAGVLVDPVPRYRTHAPAAAREFLAALRAVTAEHGIPLIFDEVITGFRLALGGAQEALSITADMACFGKLTSGLGIPLTAVAGRADLLDTARTDGLLADAAAGKTWLSSTNQANHLAVVAALAQLRHLRDNYPEIVDRISGHHAVLRERLADFARRSGIPVHLRGNPRHVTVLALGAPLPDTAGYHDWVRELSSPELARALQLLSLHLRLRGVYTPGMPTMNLSAAHTEADIDHIVAAISDSLLVMAEQNLVPHGHRHKEQP
ncbi:aminotransferase class III-fold pyridoxal phosphate-dependent enzyme [Goodfellowiella coeruleoviolacea]|uniref:Glutamate-1-semialdehyde aminotransferase n=1 Tax=Goodfellowiella coeruleoviolacea TaxID=334858 RepID=A0AAE3KIR9_9PSEU|nr:aminotransferase class III-fold pyridoxal phosphate-dependent enzyme [Goodfellowiella coeruleoviolacea]MCP2167689.1 Glutamate-1-semialdehyde aminotransferase [Goodfellowiella coeruleoviolacea]